MCAGVPSAVSGPVDRGSVGLVGVFVGMMIPPPALRTRPPRAAVRCTLGVPVGGRAGVGGMSLERVDGG
ncbi:hypothetical protein GCM10027073_58350 [Streptomyces chlorus]